MRPEEAMSQPVLRLALSLAAIVGLSSARVSALGEDGVPVVVLVDNRSSAASGIVDQAGKEVARVYRHAGMRVVWRPLPVPGSPASSEDLRAFTVRLMVRAGLLPKSGPGSRVLMGAAPGGALDCGGVAFVFFDRVAEFSSTQQMAPALVLGTVAAHEIGHLLLENRGHSSEGLMRASWTAADWQRAASGFLLFSQREAERMRATLSSCG